MPDDFLRSIWSIRLPTHFQNIMAGQAEGILNVASQLDDRITDVDPLPTTASVAHTTDSANLLQRMKICPAKWQA